MTTLREAAQQALDYWEQVAWGDAVMVDKMDALRAALAEQKCPCGDRPADQCPGEWEPGCDLGANEKYAKVAEQPQPPYWGVFEGGNLHDFFTVRETAEEMAYYKGSHAVVGPIYTTPPAPQPLTIERLRDALVASRIIDPGAVEDPDDYDDGLTLHRIEALFRRIT